MPTAVKKGDVFGPLGDLAEMVFGEVPTEPAGLGMAGQMDHLPKMIRELLKTMGLKGKTGGFEDLWEGTLRDPSMQTKRRAIKLTPESQPPKSSEPDLKALERVKRRKPSGEK